MKKAIVFPYAATTGEGRDVDGDGVAETYDSVKIVGGTTYYFGKNGPDTPDDTAYNHGYFPTVSSHSITIQAEADKNHPEHNVYTFYYVYATNISYTVRYVNRETNVVMETETHTTQSAVVTERFKTFTDMVPDAFYKRLILEVEENESGEWVETQNNVITFYYTPNKTNAYYAVHFMLEKLDATDADDNYTYTGAIVGYINSATALGGIKDNAYYAPSCRNKVGTNKATGTLADTATASVVTSSNSTVTWTNNNWYVAPAGEITLGGTVYGAKISFGGITISGGLVTANGGKNAAGMGASISCTAPGDLGGITVSGGQVTANGGENGAGIGVGNRSEAAVLGTVSVEDGILTAVGGANAYAFMAAPVLSPAKTWEVSAGNTVDTLAVVDSPVDSTYTAQTAVRVRSSTASDTVISVDITWLSMEFTYVAGDWDPQTHGYADGVWQATQNGGVIAVQNNGNVAVNATFTFTSSMSAMSGSFSKPRMTLSDGQRDTTTLSLSGEPDATTLSNEPLGTVTVTIEKKDSIR